LSSVKAVRLQVSGSVVEHHQATSRDASYWDNFSRNQPARVRFPRFMLPSSVCCSTQFRNIRQSSM
jgi:hypothetical protein